MMATKLVCTNYINLKTKTTARDLDHKRDLLDSLIEDYNDGKYKAITYDQYGDRHRQFDLNDSRGRAAHQHNYEYSQQITRPRGYRTKEHAKIDE